MIYLNDQIRFWWLQITLYYPTFKVYHRIRNIKKVSIMLILVKEVRGSLAKLLYI